VTTSNRRVLSLLAASLVAIAAVITTANPGAAWDEPFRRDPDLIVDAESLKSVVIQLLAPASTIGDGDTSAVGVGTEPVGVDLFAETSFEVTASSSGTTYWVDNTPLNGDCPQATFATIQAAILASGPNDTVKVCPGTYPEQVRIIGHEHDGLKLESLKPLQAVIQWPPAETPPLALVYFSQADGVTLRGFTVTGPFTSPGCSVERHEGILVENAFDERIDHNHITQIRNSNPALWGCQEGDAVAIGKRVDPIPTAPPGSARVDHNVIDEYQKNGVQVSNIGSSAQVDHNVITGSTAGQAVIASNGVVVFRRAIGTVDHNVISNNKFAPFPLSTGVIVQETPPGSSRVNHNRIFDNDFGVQTFALSDLEISHNDLFRHVGTGIVLAGPSTGVVVRSNDIESNRGSGIALFDADANLLKSNHIELNGNPVLVDMTDGIRVNSLSAGNRILTNHMSENDTHDCHDDSVGGGTAGTANEWEGNTGQTENRLGLCRGATFIP
jgi:parallel beta-helix repeat protein